MSELQATREYLNFRSRLDAMTAEAWEAYQSKMACKVGCFSCCRNDFHISLIEALEVKKAFRELPNDIKNAILKNLAGDDKTYCPLLVEGQCSIYESRPVLCRIFGFPVSDGETIATCELNFTEDRTETFTAKCFDQKALYEITRTLSKFYLEEIGQPLPADTQPPVVRIEEILKQETL